MSTSSSLDALWRSALGMLETKSWPSVISEFTARLAALRRAARSPDEIENTELVYSTLAQKFGRLSQAETTLVKLRESRNPAIASESRIRHSKLLSQQGAFGASLDSLSCLVSSAGEARRIPDDLPSSAIWRLGFLSAATGSSDEADYWFDCHNERVSTGHLSQQANNVMFRTLPLVTRERIDRTTLHESSKAAFDLYVEAGLDVHHVRYVNVAKSLLVPMLIEAAVLLHYKELFSGLTQLLLCRSLMRYERIDFCSEGVAECLALIKRMEVGTGPPFEAIIRMSRVSDGRLVESLSVYFDRALVEEAIDIAACEFARYVDARRTNTLMVANLQGLRRTREAHTGLTVYFAWEGRSEIAGDIKLFLLEEFGCKLLEPTAPRFVGQSRAEVLRRAGTVCDLAIIELRPQLLYDVGVMHSRLGHSRVILLSQEGSNELGFSSISIPLENWKSSYSALARAIKQVQH